MPKPTSVYITEPCHQNWTTMTATEQGKFCTACSKQVTNFSVMTDQQILTFLSNHKGSVCGRFHQHQLERTLVQQKITKRKSLWLALTLPFVVLFQKSFGQKATFHRQGTVTHVVKEKTIAKEMTMGLISAPPIVETKTIHGKVTDDKNEPLRSATVIIKETNQMTVSDSAGMFSFDVTGNDSITLSADYIGYITAEKRIAPTDYLRQIPVIMKVQPVMMGEVVVIGSYGRRARKTHTSHNITTTEKVDSSIRKIFKINSFEVYPNPATKGSEVHVTIKQAGSYELQLLDNKSNLLTTQRTAGLDNNTTIPFAIPNDISAGIYYLRVTGLNKSQSSLEKIVIR